jgi:hypothetical protein
MSGHWPPEWEDQEEEFPEGADQLSEVTAYLASVPAPVLPDNVEARISAALAAEAAGRASAAAAGDGAARTEDASTGAQDGSAAGSLADSRVLGPAPARARVGRHRGRQRGSRVPMAVGSLVVCLLLAGLGFGLSRIGTSGTASSSSAASAPLAQSSSSSAAAAAPAASAAAGPGLGASQPFSVTESGTKYQSATLAAQVRARLAAGAVHVPGPSSTVSAPTNAPAAGHASASTSALSGCVTQLTGGQAPRLVDRATYRGEPAYIIADSSRVWVVGLGCTAAKPELIVSVPLAG